MGILHATLQKRKFFLLVASYAISILMFLGFQVLVLFMYQATPPLRDYIPDISIQPVQFSEDIQPEILTRDLRNRIQSIPGVDKVYARAFSYDIPTSIEGQKYTMTLLTYDDLQFTWANEDLMDGSIQAVQQELGGVLVLYKPEVWNTNDKITLHFPSGDKDIFIKGSLIRLPFEPNYRNNFGYLICSESTYKELMGDIDYAIIDVQLDDENSEKVIQQIRDTIGQEMLLSDRRQANSESKAAFYTMAMFIYGFLISIGSITVVFIISIMNASVLARIRQYGVIRALGMGSRQFTIMVLAESLTYSLVGCFIGCGLAIPLHYILFQKIVVSNFPIIKWNIPDVSLVVILILCLFSTLVSVIRPIKFIKMQNIQKLIQS